jgi:hypothetical protein
MSWFTEERAKFLAKLHAKPNKVQLRVANKIRDRIKSSGVLPLILKAVNASVPLAKQLDEITKNPRYAERVHIVEDLQKNSDDPWVREVIRDYSGKLMGDANDKRPEIRKAIIAVRGHNDPHEHPYKLAGEILHDVNRWLKKTGQKPAGKDRKTGKEAIARRIPQAPRAKARRPRSRKI